MLAISSFYTFRGGEVGTPFGLFAPFRYSCHNGDFFALGVGGEISVADSNLGVGRHPCRLGFADRTSLPIGDLEIMATTSPLRSVWDFGFVVGLCVVFVLSRLFPAVGVVWALAGGGVIVGFAMVELRRGIRRWGEVGIRTDNLRPASVLALRVLGSPVAASMVSAMLKGISRPAHFAIALFAYSVWGFCQQVIFPGVLLEAFRWLNWGY